MSTISYVFSGRQCLQFSPFAWLSGGDCVGCRQTQHVPCSSQKLQQEGPSLPDRQREDPQEVSVTEQFTTVLTVLENLQDVI